MNGYSVRLDAVLARTGVDRAVVYVILTRAWQAASGIGTVLLIAHFLSPKAQGFYYTFASLIALQSFVELGLHLVITNVASHEWARLDLNRSGAITGDKFALARLASLGRFVFKWYSAASAVFVVVIGIAGWRFLSQEGDASVNWQAPWLAVAILTGVTLWTLPFVALLEGCDQVVTVNGYRFVQAAASTFAVWLAIALGGELWALGASVGVSAVFGLHLLMVRYREFFRSFLRLPAHAAIAWKEEVWPMQWRLAAQGVVNYFMYWLATPVVFHYHGAEAAGKIGMTWQIVAMLQTVATAWLHTKVPQFGRLIASKQYDELDRLWRQTFMVTSGILLTGVGVILIVVLTLHFVSPTLAERLAEPFPTTLLLMAAIASHVVQCEAAYLRAHKREPLLIPGILSGILSGLVIWTLGRAYGVSGAAFGYFFVMTFISLPLVTAIWHRARLSWRFI